MPTPHYGQPRYRVIAGILRERIERGLIGPGSLLPSESTLTAEFRASRGTIRQAMALLRNDGLVATEHGRGTYAIPHGRDCKPSQISYPEVRKQIVAADATLAALFNIEVGARLIEHESIIRIDGRVESIIREYRAYIEQR
ncbi:GntR family transcriptional regulator [Micromonospora sp. NBS 11-29]|uniref:GntR family transcriptional regulator n=1 Tax=Micromonospora sp. NBS 11-29 TaxID=1960879 RepID=UPI00159381EB|nr:GntR family transcriptional regulator [Micromonospora sp. NBS 11-29]